MKKFNEFAKHLDVLQRASKEDLHNEFIVSGIINKFYLEFELGWKVLKELLKYSGRDISTTGSPREIIKASYSCFDFIDEEMWLEMLNKRNDTTHIYNEEAAQKLLGDILNKYIDVFAKMKKSIEEQFEEVL